EGDFRDRYGLFGARSIGERQEAPGSRRRPGTAREHARAMSSLAPLTRSFRVKVAGAALATACVALIAAFSLLFARHWTSERAKFSEDRIISAEVIAGNLAEALIFQDDENATATLASARPIPNFSRAAVFDAQGRPFARMGRAERNPLKPNGAMS